MQKTPQPQRGASRVWWPMSANGVLTTSTRALSRLCRITRPNRAQSHHRTVRGSLAMPTVGALVSGTAEKVSMRLPETALMMKSDPDSLCPGSV